MVKAIDRLVATDEIPGSIRLAGWTLLVPRDVRAGLELKNIQVLQAGSRTGHAWDQIDLARAARTGPLISLANSGPIFHHDQRVVIHDAQVFRHPEFFDRKYAFFHRRLGRLLAARAKLSTVSEFSRRELADVLALPANRMEVYPNSAEHLAGLTADLSILSRLQLNPGHFFLAVGSLKKNKNIRLAINAAQSLGRPDYPLVVVGAENERVFGHEDLAADQHVIFAGRLSDECLAALYQHATAFVFPSLYEGFGVPPLEAMLFGCPVIASDIGPARETCGDAAWYFSPTDASELSALMKARIGKGALSETERRQQLERLSRYSWRSSALALLNSFK